MVKDKTAWHWRYLRPFLQAMYSHLCRTAEACSRESLYWENARFNFATVFCAPRCLLAAKSWTINALDLYTCKCICADYNVNEKLRGLRLSDSSALSRRKLSDILWCRAYFYQWWKSVVIDCDPFHGTSECPIWNETWRHKVRPCLCWRTWRTENMPYCRRGLILAKSSFLTRVAMTREYRWKQTSYLLPLYLTRCKWA